ncbi:MAG: ferrous iron transport protein B, partial [Spirochaetota bacterium]
AQEAITLLESSFKLDSETVITDAKYGFIAGALKETFKPGLVIRRRATDKIDAFLTSRLFGFPIFLFFMWLVFQGTFGIGQYPMGWIDSGVQLLSGFVSTALPDGTLKALLVDGIIAGVGGVIVYLPNILILFFFISLMEDTGYMARAAFIMDRIMHRIGLHGKSFIPLIMGFGCNVPAIMAARTIESRNDRIVTILIMPFMSCSARLPVYVLFISAFFPSNPGTVLFLLYGLGIAIASGSALLLKNTFFRSKDIPFVMELPPYRIPTMKSALRHMWDKGVQYLKKMGGVILIASIIIWALGHFPRNPELSQDYDRLITAVEQSVSSGAQDEQISRKIGEISRMKEAERQEKSYIGQIGKTIEPVIEPLGFDWRIGVSIISGLAAKEIVVSSLSVLLNADIQSDETNADLKNKILFQTVTSGTRAGEKLFTPLVALSFMVFILIYFPCIATIVAMKKETGSLKWSVFSMLYSTGMAWMLSFVIYQIGSLFFQA